MHQAQAEISSAEFTEWMAYYQLEPFGEQIADMRHGIACALLANVNRNADNKPEPYKPNDFVSWTKKETSEPEPVQLADPVAQSDLIRAAVFGIAPKVMA